MQGERRFFRTVIKWLANYDQDAVRRNLIHVPEYGRWDDLFVLFGTDLEDEVLKLIRDQLILDTQCQTPSLLAKWLPSENASSKKSYVQANTIRKYLGWTHKQYRKTLSVLRARINVLERLMSAGEWEKIQFDSIPSKAGLIYKNAFAHHDVERMKAGATKSYEEFAKDATTKVNAKALNPVDIAGEIFNYGDWYGNNQPTEIQRLMWDKYWSCLKDYYNGKEEPGIAIVDVSGSMSGQPMNAAVSMGAYIAERGKGPFQNHFITFSNDPQLVEFEGVDIYDKFQRARNADWGGSTNLEATLDMMLNIILTNNVPIEDCPKVLYIFSDMEFNGVISCGAPSSSRWSSCKAINVDTLIESMKKKWLNHGIKMPKIIFWNLNARNQNIPAIGEGFSYVSGFSMNMIEEILSGEDGYSLMMKKLNNERYNLIH